MKLVTDWKDCWKWVSMNSMAAATVMQGAWMAIPDDLRAAMPSNIIHIATIALLITGIVGRMVKQGGQ